MRTTRLALLAALAAAVFGQSPIEPEFEDVFYGVGHQGDLVKLERIAAASHVKMGVLMNATGKLEFQGSKSPVRFQSGRPLIFVVRSSANGDPEAQYQIRKLQSKKNSREASLVRASVLGVSTKIAAAGIIPGEFSRYGQSSLKLTVSLEPGEYAMGRTYALLSSQTVFCFGVD